MTTHGSILRWSIFFLVCQSSVACSPVQKATDREVERTESDTRFDNNKTLFAAIRDIDTMRLYEGLPHQMFEKPLLDKEKQEKATVQLHGYPFYRETLEVKVEDRDAIRKLLSDLGSFQPWTGEKKCGGFHPDYLVEWRTKNQEYRFLICFGCSEAKVYGPENSLRCDLSREAESQLKDLLKKYRKNRPESDAGE